MSKLALFAFLSAALYAQQPPASPKPTTPKPEFPHGTLAGVVVEEGTKTPIERAQVTVIGSDGSEIGSQTDAEGKFGGPLRPGSYRVTIRRRGPSGNVGLAIDVTSVAVDKETKLEIRMPRSAEVKGRVVDQRGEPVPNARVTLMLRGYETKSSRTSYQATPFTTQSNDLGEYTLTDVPGGVPFYPYAEAKFAQVTESTGPGARAAETNSTAAADQAARRPVLASSFYPGSTDPGGAQSVTFNNGESREKLDIRMERTSPYCAVGQVILPVMAATPHTMNLDRFEVDNGVFNDVGAFRTGRTIRLNDQGEVKICELWPGTYRFTVQPEMLAAEKAFFGRGTFTITDKDISTITLNFGAPVANWEGEVTIDGPQPEQPLQSRLQLRTIPTTVSSAGRGTATSIPGKFTLPNLHVDDYLFVMGGFPDGWYVKNIFYGDIDLKQWVGLFLSDPAVPVKVVLAPKGAKIKVKVTDDKGQPVAGKLVTLVRRDLKEAQALVGRMMQCYSDEKGECSVFTLVFQPPYTTLAPGEYTVLAADLPYNKYADAYDQIWKTLQTVGTRAVLTAEKTTEVAVRVETLR